MMMRQGAEELLAVVGGMGDTRMHGPAYRQKYIFQYVYEQAASKIGY